MSKPKFPKKLYTPADYDTYTCADWTEHGFDDSEYEADGNTPIEGARFAYTVSPDPEAQGWTNDSGFCGYGLPKAMAEEICRRWNIVAEMEGDDE